VPKVGARVGSRGVQGHTVSGVFSLRRRRSTACSRSLVQDTAHIAKQRDEIRATLETTVRTFKEAGCRVSDSQANFILVDVKRPAKEFREACERMGVLIGRDFPPLTNWARVSIGTADEMRVANDVFKKVLAAPAATASR
jgi:histidinol-phosphate aminotransferase